MNQSGVIWWCTVHFHIYVLSGPSAVLRAWTICCFLLISSVEDSYRDTLSMFICNTLDNIFGQVAQHYSDGSDSHGTHIMIKPTLYSALDKTSVKWIIESTNWKVSFKCLPHLCNLCKIRPPLFVDFLVSLLGIECIIKTIMSLFICLFNVWPSDYRL